MWIPLLILALIIWFVYLTRDKNVKKKDKPDDDFLYYSDGDG